MIHALLFAAAGLVTAATPPAPKPAPAAKPATTVAADPGVHPKVSIKTNMGEPIVVELYSDKAPKTVENFLAYVREKHYSGTVFHRVIKDFMIQGGGFTKDLKQKPVHAPIKNEANNGMSNQKGTISMARTGDPHSATAQFFINTVDNPRLDYVSSEQQATWGYCVFGKVISGMETVEAIRAVPTGPKGPFPTDVPTTDVVIESIDLVN